MKPATCLFTAALVLASLSATAGSELFRDGSVIAGYGKTAPVPDAVPIPDGTLFKVSFDLSKGAHQGDVNRGLDTAARFLNMHHAAGVPVDHIHLALVVHGSARNDLLGEEAYGGSNPNAPLLAQLVKHGVKIYLCGQTAAYYDVDPEDLLPGVEISLSAMTSHALLQQQGYTLNPF